MSVVPPELRKDINPYSGWLVGVYSKKTLKGLFLTECNKKYLVRELYTLLQSKQYIKDTIGDSTKVGLFRRSRPLLMRIVPDIMQSWPIPHNEDLKIANPIMQLSNLNQDFLLTTSKAYLESPDTLFSDVWHHDPETNTKTVGESDYDNSSWSDGTWHPEHLFTNTAENRNTRYWSPVEVNIPSSGPGNRYNSITYDFSGGGTFPTWQYHKRDYSLDNDETLREGGRSDRRTQSNRGYNMHALMSKPSY